MREKKIAIVYDWIDKWGGVERVLLTLHEIFPSADFYTSYYDPKKADWAKELNLHPSFIQKIPSFIKNNRIFSIPFYPYAFESFDFKDYDLVISVTSSFAKSIITRPETLHICYLLTPTRYLWLYPEQYIKNPFSKIISKPFINAWKKWDYVAAQRPDRILSISKTVQTRCWQYYKRESEVVYPPFDLEYWTNIKKNINSHSGRILSLSKETDRIPLGSYSPPAGELQDDKIHDKYFLVVSRLEPYKRVDLVVDVFNKLLNENLVIVGTGSQLRDLKKRAKTNTQFIEYLEDEELANYYSSAECLIIPQEEDFGYVALEAQFFGCPIVAYNKGGSIELIKENETGIFFQEQTVDSLTEAIARFHTMSYNLKKSTNNLKRFDKKIFEVSLFDKINI